jgi:hypothetical protein
MRRLVLAILVAAGTFAGVAAADASDYCSGLVNVCPTASQCSGTVNVCPNADECYDGINICRNPVVAP